MIMLKGSPRKIIFTALIVLLALTVVLFNKDYLLRWWFRPNETMPATRMFGQSQNSKIEVVAENLTVPWEIEFLPEGDVLVTERPGRLKRIGQKQAIIEIEGVKHIGEGGLLGLALHPDYKSNGWLYLYFTTDTTEGTTNRVERYALKNNELTEKKVIIQGIPGARVHDGGRLAFGPDRFLYIATGDAGKEQLAQDKNSLAGKILRVGEDGTIPSENPFGNAVYSYGHRNPQGLAWDTRGRLWATEHGRSGVRSGYDEINLIEKGKNYGWPVIEGDETRLGMERPMAHSGSKTTWAPAGLSIVRDNLLFAGLRGESLYTGEIKTGQVGNVRSQLRGEFGRLRAVRLAPDGFIYILTSNRDGRGEARPGDDKIIKLNQTAVFQ